jgi:hypothetical protein
LEFIINCWFAMENKLSGAQASLLKNANL